MRKPKETTLWYAFLATLFVQLAGGFLYFVVLSDTSSIQALYSATKLIMLLAPIVLVYLGLQLPRFELRSKLGESIVLGLATGLAISALVYGVFTIFDATFFSFAGNIREAVDEFGILKYYVAVAIVFSIFHSLFEEYFWRWYVVGGLEKKMSLRKAIWLGAGLFAMHHYIVLSQFFPIEITILFGTLVGVGGAIWSYIYKRTGSLLGAWVSHAIVDGALFTIGYALLS